MIKAPGNKGNAANEQKTPVKLESLFNWKLKKIRWGSFERMRVGFLSSVTVLVISELYHIISAPPEGGAGLRSALWGGLTEVCLWFALWFTWVVHNCDELFHPQSRGHMEKRGHRCVNWNMSEDNIKIQIHSTHTVSHQILKNKPQDLQINKSAAETVKKMAKMQHYTGGVFFLDL